MGSEGSGFRVQGPGFRVQGSGFRVQALGWRPTARRGRSEPTSVMAKAKGTLSSAASRTYARFISFGVLTKITDPKQYLLFNHSNFS